MDWESLDWRTLDRLRETFLTGQSAVASYWQHRADLENYDFTYAQRIGWKWDAVLGDLKRLGWQPPAGEVLDWGCGSGIAGRRVVDCFGAKQFQALRVYDRSALAMDFAVERARRIFPKLKVEIMEHRSPTLREDPMASADTAEPEFGVPGTLLLSHVLNELTEASRADLLQLVHRADAVLWVEPGTHVDSRALISVREALRENFHVIAPCTHPAGCGLLTPENERHWCHFFASPPKGIMGDSNWVRFALRAGIDLRALPYSYLVLERKGLREPVPGLLPGDWSRVIGEPRVYKGFAKVLSCQADGVHEVEFQKRAAPEEHKAMRDGNAAAIYKWGFTEGRVTSIERLAS
jgi:hypothetical protein